jgi:hypothetical protein
MGIEVEDWRVLIDPADALNRRLEDALMGAESKPSNEYWAKLDAEIRDSREHIRSSEQLGAVQSEALLKHFTL